MNEPVPRFTGIFIPVEILELKNLSYLEKFLLSWIDALYCKEHGGCFASNEYLANKLDAKENTISKALTHLRKLKLIKDVSFDGRTRVMKAQINEAVLRGQSKSGLDKNPSRVGQKSKATLEKNPYPSYIESKDYIKDKKESQPAERLASKLLSSIRKINPKAKQPNLNHWIDDIEKIQRIDGRSEEEIATVINWVFRDAFWCKNILSGRKLREKFDQLFMAMESEKLTPKGNRPDRRTKNIDGTPVDSPADGLF